MKTLKLGSNWSQDSEDPYLIAEIGVNHGGSLQRAFSQIELAASSGANCAKFQTYKAELLAAEVSPAYWDTAREPTRSQRELFKKFDGLGPDDYKALAEKCRTVGIDFATTVFDLDAVQWVSPLVSFFKIASADITNIPLLREIGAQGKPVIVSTGASTEEEITAALSVLQRAGAPDVAILHCILAYPTSPEDANLGMIKSLRNLFPNHVIGYSDHTQFDGDGTALALAFELGAQILEKHFSDTPGLDGNDHYHAVGPEGLSKFWETLRYRRALIGSAEMKMPVTAEESARTHARRGVYARKTIAEGSKIDETDLIALRPPTDLPIEDWDMIIGRKTGRRISAGEPFTKDMFDW